MSNIAVETLNGHRPLPVELWTRIIRCLAAIEDISVLWTRYRPVSMTFKKEIESYFHQEHLPGMKIRFSLEPLRRIFTFNRLAEDENIAVFKFDNSLDNALPNKSFDNMKPTLRQYLDNTDSEAEILKPRHYLQFGEHFNDTPLTPISIDQKALEISCAWIPIVSYLFHEEVVVEDLMARWEQTRDTLKDETASQVSSRFNLLGVADAAMEGFRRHHVLCTREARKRRIERQLKALPQANGEFSGWNAQREEAEGMGFNNMTIIKALWAYEEKSGNVYQEDDEEGEDEEYYEEEEEQNQLEDDEDEEEEELDSDDEMRFGDGGTNVITFGSTAG